MSGKQSIFSCRAIISLDGDVAWESECQSPIGSYHCFRIRNSKKYFFWSWLYWLERRWSEMLEVIVSRCGPPQISFYVENLLIPSTSKSSPESCKLRMIRSG